jgi:phage minor structural protein
LILIYESTETDFDNLGLGALVPTSCLITEELNGQYSLAMSHPIDEDGKWEKIQQNRIIKAPTHDGDQLFRLFRPVTNSKTGMIDVSALHVFYDLNDNLIEDTRPTVKDGQDAGDIILAGCQYATDFTFSSDIEDISTAYYIRKTPVEAFIGSEDQSFINRWGGEIRRNNFEIEINERRGSDAGMVIAYRKNLSGVECWSDMSQVVTRIMPTALTENAVVFYTDAKYYDSTLIGSYPHPKIGILDTGIRVNQEVDGSIPYASEAAAKVAMAEMAQACFDAGVDTPEVSMSVTYVNLGDTDEYAAYKDIIKQASMGDDVTLEHPELDIDVKLRVVKIEWNAIDDRVSSIVLGSQQPNFANSTVSRDIDLSALKNNAPANLQEGDVYNGVYINHSDGFMTEAIISGKTITTRQNSEDGFALYEGGTFLGGLKVISSQAALISGVLQNVLSSKCYAKIGTVTIDTEEYEGIFVYHTDISSSDPAFMIVANGSPSYQVITICDSDGNPRIQFDSSGGMFLLDASGVSRVEFSSFDTTLWYNNQMAIGVNSTGPYYVKSGTTHYF